MGLAFLSFLQSQDLLLRSTDARSDDVQQRHDTAQCQQCFSHKNTMLNMFPNINVPQQPVMCILISDSTLISLLAAHCTQSKFIYKSVKTVLLIIK